MNNIAGAKSDLSIDPLTASYVTVESVILDVPDDWEAADLFMHGMVKVDSMNGASRIDVRMAAAGQIGDVYIPTGVFRWVDHFGLAPVASTITVQLQARAIGGPAELARVILFADAIFAA